MKAAITKAYALDTPRESEGGAGPDAWNVEGAARFANRLLWSALVDIVAVDDANSAGRAVSTEKQDLATSARVWIAGAEDCRVTFDICVELLFSSDIPDLADKLRDAIEADPSRVLALVEVAMREAEYESTVYRFMQRASAEDAASEQVVEAAHVPSEVATSLPTHATAWKHPETPCVSTQAVTTALMVDVPPLPVQSSIAVRVLAGGQYLLPLFGDQEDPDRFVGAYDDGSARSQRPRGM
ncbi:hypothetical protein [Cupriavidus sp. TMH.W2]|uniref:hypothetical protein n=1 Tax=Cupriavidus sp. TMH.W2 TaxID=3434465 RepID=UPI003D77069E